MRESVPGTAKETDGKGALNKPGNPSWPGEESGQFFLGSPDSQVLEAASLVCAAVKEAQQRGDGFTLGTIATLVHKETPYVSKCLDKDDPHAALLMLMAAIRLDAENVILRCLSRMKGCELVVKPRMTPEQKVQALEAYLRRRGKVGEMEIAEAYGEKLP